MWRATEKALTAIGKALYLFEWVQRVRFHSGRIVFSSGSKFVARKVNFSAAAAVKNTHKTHTTNKIHLSKQTKKTMGRGEDGRRRGARAARAACAARAARAGAARAERGGRPPQLRAHAARLRPPPAAVRAGWIG